ncbi:hypothetical protein BDV98DRAFT_574002 [Pterulicium gracile]|uniref:Outer membrane protein TOM13-domain-containing protein n=1 Tax=Pterulicium gracile TaxID=1884261 RepID=A0A5C3Q7W2_9AGAR|nr:hypothetical protein BDV98DRAFT_574002 [Pterula gracilis]
MNSSLPSMSYPERTNPHTPEPKLPSTTEPTTKPAAEQSFSTTKAIFDPTLSNQVRLSALAASLAINLLLPFVNGVMLGFGEVFAKNVLVGWFGWDRMAGPWSAKKKTTGSVGVGVPLPSERKARTEL